MDEATVRRLLEEVRTGATSPDEAIEQLRRLPFENLGFARIDHHRGLRQGQGEAVYGPGKTPDQCVTIVGRLLEVGQDPVILTRASEEQADATLGRHPGGHRLGSTVVWRPATSRPERVVVVTAGTADLPVAEECAATLWAHGLDPGRLTDVGVAGVHRLLDSVDLLLDADVVIVIAGMEGALASIVGGITGAPVIAVPTSAGYGTAFAGVTALLAMLSSCAAGLTVVGIDNGFGAAAAVRRLLK